MRLDFAPPSPTYPQYAALYDQARRTSGTVDPAKVYLPDLIARRRGYDWAAAVIGRPYNGIRAISCVEARLMELADAAGIDPPLPQWLVDARAATAEHRRRLDEQRAAARRHDEEVWSAARNACLVQLDVRPNQTAQVRNGQRQHLGHAVPRADAVSGRSRRHPAGRSLCETNGRRPMRLGEPADEPATCVRCLDWTTKVRPADDTSSIPGGGTQ